MSETSDQISDDMKNANLVQFQEEQADFREQLESNLGGLEANVSVIADELEIQTSVGQLVGVMTKLKEGSALQFSTLLDVTAVDYPNRFPRFDMIYILLSMKYNKRVRVKVAVGPQDFIPSVTGVWSAANWYEREVWDMYGLMFTGHPDLRRLLSDYGFDGHPLRKDFPLTGYVEVRYDSEQGRVVYEPVKLQQEYRSFDYSSPWEGMSIQEPLPGDEKAEGGAN